MKETEKRTGLSQDEARRLKSRLDRQYERISVVPRTVVVKVDNDDFSPNPDALVDIKTKLVGSETLLSVKYGSWHGNTARQEHEVQFRRADLDSLLAILKLFGYSKFIVLSTVRTTWAAPGVSITLDEYQQLGKALFEVELTEKVQDEALIDHTFTALDIQSMDSEQTIDFISSLNQAREIQVDLDNIEVATLADTILAGHSA